MAGSASGSAGLSFKAILAGLLGIAVVCLYSSTNDRLLKLSPLIGNHLPIAAFSYVLVLAAMWNPVLGRITRALRFSTRELAVVLGMMLLCSWIPGSSLYRYLESYIIVPWTTAQEHPNWTDQHTLSYIPEGLTPLSHDPGTDPARYPPGSEAQKRQQEAYHRVYSGFKDGESTLGITQAPYREWLPSMSRWWLLAFSMGVMLLAMIWVVHRQWAHHEQLAYPIASVATALITRSGSRITSDLFHSRLFWASFIPVFIFHSFNYLSMWYPNYIPHVSISMWAMDLNNLWPALNHTDWSLNQLWLFFSIVGLAYFIPSEISLSMGISTICITLVAVTVYLARGTPMSGENEFSTLAGAYIGYFAIMLFTGRDYYLQVVRQAVGMAAGIALPQQVWAARLFLVGTAVFVGSLVVVGHLDPLIALLFALALMIYFLVFARIIAETGVPFMQAPWDAGFTICQVVGFPAIGPGNIVMIQFLSQALNPDARECITPYVANTLKMADTAGVNIPRLITIGIIGTMIALVLSFLAQTFTVYKYGAITIDTFSYSRPDTCLDTATTGLTNLSDLGLTNSSNATHGLAKIGLLGKNVGHAEAFGWIGFGVVAELGMSLLRFRFRWWPLHPIIFLVWATWTAKVVWLSFLVGWAIKQLIVHYGGGRTYQNLKPLFIGLIMGELVAASSTLVVGALYYWLSGGLLPKSYKIFPG